MKVQLKSAVTLSFISIVCLIAALLSSAMKKIYIESWFVLNRNIIAGFVSGLLLTSIVSFSNLAHARRLRARERCTLLEAFFSESSAFQAQFGEPFQTSGARAISPTGQYELGQALARLHERASAILRSERISTLKSSAIQKGGPLIPKTATAEEAFEHVFTRFSEGCNETYQLHSSLPYLSDESERQTAFSRFLHQLNALCAALAPESALLNATAHYRAAIGAVLGETRKKN